MDREKRRRGAGERLTGHRKTAERDLRRALAQGELTAEYQPVARAADDEVVGLEALARWRRRDGRLLEARHFVGAARDAGVLSEIDRRILTIVATDAGRSRLPAGLEWISVNVTPRSLAIRGFTSRLEALAEELGELDLRLVVELSQRADDARLREAASELDSIRRGSNIRLALDDYGSKPFLVDRALDLPIDLVKIDVSPLPAVSDRPTRGGYTRALLRISRSLGRKVVLEGIERSRRGDGSLVAEADLIQGFHVGRPGLLTDGG